MRKWICFLAILIVSVLLLSACVGNKGESQSSKETNESAQTVGEDNQQETKKKNPSIAELIEDLPEPTMTAEEIVNAAPGPFSGMKFDDLQSGEKEKFLEEYKDFPKVEGEPTEEEIELYWRKTLALFHEDFPDPTRIIQETEIASFGSPEMEDPRYQFKEHLNVQILLDASGSMGNIIDGKTMMNIAKDSIKKFASTLPEEANIAVRVYGHKGSGSKKDKELSCNSHELIYGAKSYNQKELNESLSKINPAGWTPLAQAIKEAGKDLSQYDGENNTNIVYIVSDGVETCGGDPIAEAKKLADSNIQPIVNVIGFDLDAKGKKQLQDVAKAAKGMYSDARNQAELQREFEMAQKIAEKWKDWKEGAISQALNDSFEKKLKDIPAFISTWIKTKWAEEDNTANGLRYLRDNEQISRQAFLAINGRGENRSRHLTRIYEQLEKDLRRLTEENFEQTKEEILKKYRENAK